jgi:hypothetical protein
MNYGLVYTLSHPLTGEVRYVGKTERTLGVRLIEHRYRATQKNQRSHLYTWLRKLARQGLTPIIRELQRTRSSYLYEAEEYWIEELKSRGLRLINTSSGGRGRPRGLKHTEESRARMSLAQRGSKKPQMSLTMRGNQRAKGRAQTLEERVRRSRSQGGRPFADQFGNVYNSAREPSRVGRGCQASVVRVLKGKQHTTMGFVYKYLDS